MPGQASAVRRAKVSKEKQSKNVRPLEAQPDGAVATNKRKKNVLPLEVQPNDQADQAGQAGVCCAEAAKKKTNVKQPEGEAHRAVVFRQAGLYYYPPWTKKTVVTGPLEAQYDSLTLMQLVEKSAKLNKPISHLSEREVIHGWWKLR